MFNFEFHELNGVKTCFQSLGGSVDASKVVPQNLFTTMFETRCGVKQNIYAPNIFFGVCVCVCCVCVCVLCVCCVCVCVCVCVCASLYVCVCVRLILNVAGGEFKCICKDER